MTKYRSERHRNDATSDAPVRSSAMMPFLLGIVAILVIGGIAMMMIGGINPDRTAEPVTQRLETTGAGPAVPAPAVRDRGTGTNPPEANKPTLVPDPSAPNVR